MDGHNILITGCRIVSMRDDMPRCFTGAVGISGNEIAIVEPEGSPETDMFRHRAESGLLTEIDGTGTVVMPGLINTHNHVAMTLLRGYADDMSLMDWLHGKIWPFEAKMTREDVIAGAKLGIAEMLLGGTTTFVDMYKMQEAVAVAATEGGIRCVLTSAVTDEWLREFEEDIIAVRDRYGLRGNDMLRFMLAPHAPYTNSEVTLRRVKQLSEQYGLGINVHVAETRDETEIIRERYGKTPVEYLNDAGLITEDTLVVHCVWPTDGDIEILARQGASIAHCPESNVKLASGISPVGKMISAGINVSIGTDGPSSNNDLDMWGEMRSASFLQKVSTGDPKVIPAYETLKMSTVNGAKAIGFGDRLGVLRPGALADVIMIDMGGPHFQPVHDVISNLAYAVKSTDVDTVIVNGRIVVRGGELLTLDTETLCREAQQSADSIKARL